MDISRKFLSKTKKHKFAILSISLVVTTVLAVYWQDLLILFNDAFRSEAVSYVLLIPLLASYLFYRKREFVKASLALEKLRAKTKVISVSNLVGVSFCFTAFLIYWYGSYTFNPLEYHVASLVIFTAGITLFLANLKTLLALLFPILFLILLVP